MEEKGKFSYLPQMILSFKNKKKYVTITHHAVANYFEH